MASELQGGKLEIGLIHLSDFHFQSDNDRLVSRVSALKRAIENRTLGWEVCFLILSGDITYSGQHSEFDVANTFINLLLSGRGEAACKIHVVSCPGNHDCELSERDPVREIVLDSITRDPTKIQDPRVLSKLLECQGNYFDFHRKLPGQSDVLPFTHRVDRFTFDKKVLRFHSLNSALMSSRSEVQGSLHFPCNDLNADPTQDSGIEVFIYHHPLNWFESGMSLRLREVLSKNADLIFTGHEHTPHSSTVRSNTLETTTEYFEGAVLQDSNSPENSEFQIIHLNLLESNISHENLRFDGENYVAQQPELKWRPIRISRNGTEVEIRAQHRKWLMDVGANFTHPRKPGGLEFYDLFIAPDLREIMGGRRGKTTLEGPTDEKTLLSATVSGKSSVIIGAEQAGKTHLGKHIYNEMASKGLLCVYLNCSKIKRVNSAREAERLIYKAVNKQYFGPGRTKFVGVERNKRVLILDDYHLLKIADEQKMTLLKFCDEQFLSVVVFADEIIQFEGLMGDREALEELFEFTWFRLLELGHVKRERLIEKWIDLGRARSVSSQEHDRDLVTTKRLIDQLIGRKLLPPTPLNLLILLQQLEILRDNPSATSGSSNGHLYTMLITHSLNRSLKELSLDGSINYLTRLAGAAFGVREGLAGQLSRNEFMDFHTEHERIFDLNISIDRLLAQLVRSGILHCFEDGAVGFRYKYIYYYFAARALAEDENLQTHLDTLIGSVHTEISSNILIFLTFHSKRELIIDSLTKKADSLFSAYRACDLSEHNAIAERLVMGSQQLALPDSSPRENRELVGRKLDDHERDESTPTESVEPDGREALELNTAFKTLQVLGQILRNTAESGTGEQKSRILASTVELGLRSLEFFVQALECVVDDVLEYVAGEVLKDASLSIREKREVAKQLLSVLLEGVCYVSVKKISNAVGTQRLERTYHTTLSKENQTHALIDLSIKLDHFAGFPQAELDRILDQIKPADLLSATVLKRMVAMHFYLRDESKSIRDRYCNRLGIRLAGSSSRAHALETPRKSLR